jgi:hypothetical protein
MFRTFGVIVSSLAVLVCVRPVAAQVCGDADGSGTVTVTDGVQTLRAAAGLDSMCTLATCDVDGNGTITVTDGVAVLRIAAGLDVTQNCPSESAGQPQLMLQQLQPLFKQGVAFATNPPPTSCLNGDGGIDVSTDTSGTDTSFSTCQVDAEIEFDGDVIVGATLLEFDALEADTAGAEDPLCDFDGSLTLGSAGSGKTLDGILDDVNTDSVGGMTVTFSHATVITGKLTGGTATIDMTQSDLSDSFTQIVLTFGTSGTAAVVATEVNGGTENFSYDIETGVATPS